MDKVKTTGKARIQFLIAATAMLSIVQSASAELIMSDDFESYTSTGTAADGLRGGPGAAGQTLPTVATTPGMGRDPRYVSRDQSFRRPHSSG